MVQTELVGVLLHKTGHLLLLGSLYLLYDQERSSVPLNHLILPHRKMSATCPIFFQSYMYNAHNLA